MNLDQLKVFHVAALKKNFSETGKILHLSQPSISLQIQQLEASLNTKLFERTTKTIRLTDSGKLLFDYAEQIIHLVEKAKKDLALLEGSIHGDLHIGASLTIGEHLLPYLLGRFKREYPKVHLLMKIDNSHEIVEQLKNGTIHLGFIEAPIAHPDLVQHPLMEDELVLICSAREPHPLIGHRDSIAAHELFSLPFIMRERGSGTRQVMEESLRSNRLDPDKLRIELELANTESIKAAVESGMGVSILSQSAIGKELQLNTLRKVNIQGIKLRRSFNVLYEKNRVLSLPSEAFLHYILGYFAGSADLVEPPPNGP
ncbi:LysR family transcriptional regulator [Brevibacillus humidisoli]|uniref:selenium metabolism-associated LysR family transcriptional regulator n=1 Tax=Brevibacillus humidisoli TaxID=2895522 RepID=UPI001E364801|nr:selenium metabolism-associated LysR family transcriptional regulator [Brevibacillus humidisoli]UFJ38929.1 LysR family transcriptional regulator [Brevibacillus humidisoli]